MNENEEERKATMKTELTEIVGQRKGPVWS